MTFFRVLWGINAILAVVALYFFIDGLKTASNSGSYLQTWLVLLLVLAVALGGSVVLKNNNHMILAKLLLSVIALPGFLYGLWIVIMLIAQPKWQ